MTIPAALQIAVQHHQAGRLGEAEALYRQILSARPNHADALHLLGVIAHQVGRDDLAVEWIRKAIGVNPKGLHYYINLGNALVAQGHFDEAITAYRWTLQVNPSYAEAHNSLGAALAGKGELDEAVAAYSRALQFKPDYPEAHNNLGNALRERGQLDESITACRRALELKSDYPEAHNNLGAALAGQGRLDEAIAEYRRALALKSDYPEAYNNLGVALAGQGRLDEAITEYRRALELRPDYPEACNNLGVALAGQGQLNEAIAAHRRALELRPGYPAALNNLGNALMDRGEIDEAVIAYRQALELKPDIPETHNNLGNALSDRGQFEEGIAAYRRALALKPDYAEACNNLGRALRKHGQLDEAVAAYCRAIELKPDFSEARSNLGDALKKRGELDEAMAAFRRSLQIEPAHAWAHSNLILALHYHPGEDHRTISEEQQRWNRQFSDPLKSVILPHTNDRSPERRLRIGYVSPDFWEHAAGRYALPLIERHDREQFEILCYSGVERPDTLTEAFRRLAHQWRSTVGVRDEALAEMIRRDRVDILVDLSQHMAGNRLPMFARKPAPVQVSFAGYPESAGLETIEYRISDRYLEAGSADKETARKEHVCLIESFWCYDPSGAEVEVNGLPARESGRVTFGCLNNFCKVNEQVLRLWARVFAKVRDSRMVLLADVGSHRRRTLETFEREGVEERRVEFVEYRPRREYLELYHGLDIVLDPFPYNGHTTSVDALWMGVPVVSLAGNTPVSRAGLSQLTNLGLPELVAYSEEDYVRIAVELAGDLPRLAQLRSTLRKRMESSVLMDAPRFARNVEAAYRSMRKRWRQTTG